MGTVRTERCPACDALVGEGLLYVHQCQECEDSTKVGSGNPVSAAERADATLRSAAPASSSQDSTFSLPDSGIRETVIQAGKQAYWATHREDLISATSLAAARAALTLAKERIDADDTPESEFDEGRIQALQVLDDLLSALSDASRVRPEDETNEDFTRPDHPRVISSAAQRGDVLAGSGPPEPEHWTPDEKDHEITRLRHELIQRLWRPIASAPKDEHMLLLYQDGYGVQAGYWYDLEVDDHFWFAVETQGSTGGKIPAPTHWMLLPEAPKEQP